jgi:hypothetical protein
MGVGVQVPLRAPVRRMLKGLKIMRLPANNFSLFDPKNGILSLVMVGSGTTLGTARNCFILFTLRKIAFGGCQ